MSAQRLAEKQPEIGASAPAWERRRPAGGFMAKLFPIHPPPGGGAPRMATARRWFFDSLSKGIIPPFSEVVGSGPTGHRVNTQRGLNS